MRATGAGACTVMGAEPVFPSLVAVIVALPPPTPVTTPLVASTVATCGRSDDHVIARPDRTAPDASRGVAERAIVPPI